MGDPQGILGGSNQFLGDPAFLDKQILWVYCIFQGDPAGELAPCIILTVRSTETGSPGKSILQLYQARRVTFLKLYQALLLKVTFCKTLPGSSSKSGPGPMSSTIHNSLSQTVMSWCLTFAALTAPASRNQGPGNLGEARGQGGQGGQGGQKTWFSSTGAEVSGRLTLGKSLPSSRVPCESMDFAPSWERTQASSQASYRKCFCMKQQSRG
jgi:hypothetical protein